jgi:hypothetical protein
VPGKAALAPVTAVAAPPGVLRVHPLVGWSAEDRAATWASSDGAGPIALDGLSDDASRTMVRPDEDERGQVETPRYVAYCGINLTDRRDASASFET